MHDLGQPNSQTQGNSWSIKQWYDVILSVHITSISHNPHFFAGVYLEAS